MFRAFAEYVRTIAPSSALQETASSITTSMLHGEQVLIAFDGSTAVGIVRFMICIDALYFYRLAIIPEKRGRGIAKMLLRRLETEATDYRRNAVICRVRRRELRNLHLYRSDGFQIFGDEEIVHKPLTVLHVIWMRKFI
jgi:ribosomal protein S18 acetylase RimI-like enzyme